MSLCSGHLVAVHGHVSGFPVKQVEVLIKPTLSLLRGESSVGSQFGS